MRISYYNSLIEKKRLQKEAHKKDEITIHCDFVDREGTSTSGSSGRLIFGFEGEQEKTIEPKFTRPASDFFFGLHSVKMLNEIFPQLRESYDKVLIDRVKKQLKIEDEKNVDIKELMRLLSLKISLKYSQLTKVKSNDPLELDEDTEIMRKIGQTQMLLPKNPDFLREMSLVYIVTRFKEYLKKILYEVFRAYPELLSNSEIEKKIDNITERGMKKCHQHLQRIFSFELKHNNWDEFVERFCRRNCIIHNNGIPNDDYWKCIESKTTTERLKVNLEYLIKSIKLFEIYGQRINNFFWTNYGWPTYLKEIESSKTSQTHSSTEK